MNYPYLKNPEMDIETVVIETPRCTIEPFRIEGIDFTDLTGAFCGANEHLYISPYLPTVEQEYEYMHSVIENRKSGKAFECFIFDKVTGTLMGSVGISDLDTEEPNLGLWIRKEYHRKGYGTEVYAAMLDWARKETNFSFFKHAVDPENTASIKLAEKFHGKLQEVMTERGHLKYYIYLK
ncbi:MAG: GNAT family N-acetyltransferase [Candidatus Gracilibacteria bacterium]|nr:GNAT family N-acetyltransferase [Candidatus Gracilibacteria bacterium]